MFFVFLSAVCFLSLLNFSSGHDVVDARTDSCFVQNGKYACRGPKHECIPLELVCNKVNDCSDSSDEDGMCGVGCGAANCEQRCQETPSGPVCLCHQGFSINQDLRTCSDIDECKVDPPYCSQDCNNTAGSFLCQCAPGYHLMRDGRHCRADLWHEGVRAYLVFLQENKIYKVAISDAMETAFPVLLRNTNDKDITTIALDVPANEIYFYSQDDRTIFNMDIQSGDIKIFANNGLDLVSSLAIDWYARNLYVGEMALQKIYVCSLKQNSVCVTLPIQDHQHPLSIAVDPRNSKLYWSECSLTQHKCRIMQSRLDGSEAKLLVDKLPCCVMSLRLDLPTSMLYWAVPEIHLIEHLRLDTLQRMNYTNIALSNNFGLDIFEEDMFFSSTKMNSDNSHTSSILHTNKYTLQTGDDPHVLVGGLEFVPHEIHVYHPVLQLPVQNACTQSGCTQVCTLVSTSTHRCFCKDGWKLAADKHKCVVDWNDHYLMTTNDNKIFKISPSGIGQLFAPLHALSSSQKIGSIAFDIRPKNLYLGAKKTGDGKSQIALVKMAASEMTTKVIYDNLPDVSSLTIDWVNKNLYWIDSFQESIQIGSLDGKFQMALLGGINSTVKLDKPTAVAVNPIDRRLYYSECGKRPALYICDLSADACVRAAAAEERSCISSILLHPTEKKLYWTDEESGNVMVANLDGSDAQLLRHSKQPFAVTKLKQETFWLDRHDDGILRNPMEEFFSSPHKINFHSEDALTGLVSSDLSLQPAAASVCADDKCSHICVTASSSSVRTICLCPFPKFLDADKKTCVDAATKIHPKFPPQQPSTVPWSFTPEDKAKVECVCFNGGFCTYKENVPSCSCPIGTTGYHCETKTGSEDKLLTTTFVPLSLHESKGSAGPSMWWLFAALIIVVVVFGGLVFIAIRNSRLPMSVLLRNAASSMQTRWHQVFHNECDDEVIHKVKLVDPSYENPGFVDEQIICEKPDRIVISPSSPSLQSFDSAYVSRGNSTYLRNIDFD